MDRLFFLFFYVRCCFNLFVKMFLYYFTHYQFIVEDKVRFYHDASHNLIVKMLEQFFGSWLTVLVVNNIYYTNTIRNL